MRKLTVAALLCALALPLSAAAQAPQGFHSSGARPQGFSLDTLVSIDEVKAKSVDEQLVAVRGRFTKQLTKDDYEFVDEKGSSIVAELDDDKDWSHIHKDALVDILAEVDKGWKRPKLEVIEAKPVQ